MNMEAAGSSLTQVVSFPLDNAIYHKTAKKTSHLTRTCILEYPSDKQNFQFPSAAHFIYWQ
jgi:hypothetical protein